MVFALLVAVFICTMCGSRHTLSRSGGDRSEYEQPLRDIASRVCAVRLAWIS